MESEEERQGEGRVGGSVRGMRLIDTFYAPKLGTHTRMYSSTTVWYRGLCLTRSAQ